MHPEETQLLEYVGDKASEDFVLAIESHIASCTKCLEQVRALQFLRENFDAVWDSWSASEHGSSFRKWRSAWALQRVSELRPSLAERARKWLEELCAGQAERAVRLLVDRTRRVAALAGGLLPQGYSFALEPAIAGVGAPGGELQERLSKGARLLEEGQAEAALVELSEAAKIDARRSQAASGGVVREGRKQVETAVDAGLGRAWVRFWPMEDEETPGFAMLVPETGSDDPLVAEFVEAKGEEYFVATFENLPSGPFRILW